MLQHLCMRLNTQHLDASEQPIEPIMYLLTCEDISIYRPILKTQRSSIFNFYAYGCNHILKVIKIFIIDNNIVCIRMQHSSETLQHCIQICRKLCTSIQKRTEAPCPVKTQMTVPVNRFFFPGHERDEVLPYHLETEENQCRIDQLPYYYFLIKQVFKTHELTRLYEYIVHIHHLQSIGDGFC